MLSWTEAGRLCRLEPTFNLGLCGDLQPVDRLACDDSSLGMHNTNERTKPKGLRHALAFSDDSLDESGLLHRPRLARFAAFQGRNSTAV